MYYTVLGFIVFQGQKIFISMRIVQECRWITRRTGEQPGTRLPEIEQALKKISGAKGKLLNGKAVPV